MLLPGLSSGWAIVHLTAIGIAIGLVTLLYRWECKLVSPRVGIALLGLRLASIAVVLLALLQPTWAWIVERERFGRLAVAIDVSDSMQMADPHATTAEKLRWATAVQWIQPHADRLTATFEPATVPAGPPPVPEGLDPETWKELSNQLSDMTRLQLAQQALLAGANPVWEQLQQVGRTSLSLFAGSTLSAEPTQLTELLADVPKSVQPDFTQSAHVLRALDIADTDSPLLGIVLLTDGRDAGAVEALATAASLGQNGIPIYPVLLGSTQRPKDLSVISVETPPAVYRGDHPQIKVLVSTAGYEGQELTVTLQKLPAPLPAKAPAPVPAASVEAAPLEVVETKTITASEGPQLVEFSVSAEELGDHHYRVSLPQWEGETRDDNNSRDVVLPVVDDRSRVLLVDHEPRWEFRYLEIALARDSRVDASVVLFDQPYMGLLPTPFFQRAWPEPTADGSTPGFSDRDLIVLGDVTAEDMTEARWKSVQQFVSEQGGVLVLVAGRGGMPLNQVSPTFQTLLPITDPRLQLAAVAVDAGPANRGWTWTLSPDGAQQTFLQLASDAADNQAIWDLLPGAAWAIRGTPKPGATVWATGRDERGANEIPLIVHHYVGLGQVIWIATDSTWRWRFRSADEFHHRFWGQLARFAANAKLSAGNEFVQFGPVQARFSGNEPVQLQARWAARFLDLPPEQREARVEILQDGQVVKQLPLDRDGKRPLLSAGQLTGLSAGNYRARLLTPNLTTSKPPLEAEFSISAPITVERAELSANPVFLQALATASGGRLLHLDELAQLPQILRPFEGVSATPQEQTLWDRWPTLLLLTLLLTSEWVLRRRHGLP